MKIIKKRFLSLLLSTALILSLFGTMPFTVAAAEFNPSVTDIIYKNDIDSINSYLEGMADPDSEQALRLKIAVEYLSNSAAQSVEYSATAPVYETTEMSVVESATQKFRYNVNMDVLSVALSAMGARNVYYGALYETKSATREELIAFEGDDAHTAEAAAIGKIKNFSITVNRSGTELGLRTSVLPYVRWTDAEGREHILYSDESVSKSPAGWLKSAIDICLSNKQSAVYLAYITRVNKMSEMDSYIDIDLFGLFEEIASTANQVEALSVLKTYRQDADKDFYYKLIIDLFSFTLSANVNAAKTPGYFNDPLNNLNNTYSSSGSWSLDSGNPAVFGDNYRLFRSGGGDAWIVYKLDAGISEFSVDAFFPGAGSEASLDDSLIQIYTSQDGLNWTQVSNPEIDNIGSSYGYYKRTYKCYGINKLNKYVKVVLPDKSVASPLLTHVRINHIDKDECRFEGRLPATFYVDAENGSDSNSGLFTTEAFRTLSKISGKYFQPGDRILFKSGQTFYGQLNISGCGSDESPIFVGTYGGEEKAKICASVGSAVTVISEHIVIENLEITNPNGTAGIFITTCGEGIKSDITVRNCYILDIDVNERQFAYQSGGIVVFVDGVYTAWIDSVVLENNVIENTARTGIYLGTTYAARPGVWGINNYVSDDEGWYPLTNCVIRGNEVTDVRGDGIMAAGAKNILIEKNTVNNAFCTQSQSGVACVAIWTTNTNDAVMQYNDVGHTNLPAGNADGDAFDIDIASVRTVVQYNYSHDNASGFLLICNFGDGYKISRDHTVRFNLSVNDVAAAGQGVFMLTGANPGTEIYNNTVYMGGNSRSVQPVYHFGDATADFTFTNNIFYGEDNISFNWQNSGADYIDFVYNNNIFWNVEIPNNAGVTVLDAVTDIDPEFADVSVSPDGAREDVIAGFTPTVSLTGAEIIQNNGGKDITGATVGEQAFYGCTLY